MNKDAGERGRRSPRPELFPTLEVVLSPLRPLQRGLRQEGIFGRFWYHRSSFCKREHRLGRAGAWAELEAPSCDSSSGLGPDAQGLLQILGSREPSHFLSAGWFLRGPEPGTSHDELLPLGNSTKSHPEAPGTPRALQASGSSPVQPRVRSATLARGAAAGLARGSRRSTPVSS